MLPRIDDLKSYAVFLDLDGTLVELIDRPDAVHVDVSTLYLLQSLQDKSADAFAVVSGREIAVIDQLLHPLKLPVAGVHGMQWRDVAGEVHSRESCDLTQVSLDLEKIIGGEPGIIIERKPGAIALHYRLRPELERRCSEIVERVVGARSDLSLLHGKMVFEIMKKGIDKGSVISIFLSEPPFRGRIPIFAGDDVTDETGFAVVNARGGISVKVGEQETVARYRAHNVQELMKWLHEIVVDDCRERVE